MSELTERQEHAEDGKVVHKFGRNSAVGTSFVPVCEGGVYRTPQPASATALRIKAGGNANDTAAGSGARSVTLQGLDANGALIQESVATAGASASSATTAEFMRLFRMWVDACGTYETAGNGSHDAAITIENAAGTEDWGVIAGSPFAEGQSQIAAYTVPAGSEAYLEKFHVSIETNKEVDILFLKREQILDAAAPYQAWRVFEAMDGLTAPLEVTAEAPYRFKGLTDILALARVSTGSASVSVGFELLLTP